MRMLWYLYAAVLITISNYNAFATTLQGKCIQFEDKHWEDILHIAKTQNKLIFVNAFADYCDPCDIMEDKVFKNEKVAQFYNEHFINYKLDLTSMYHADLQQFYEVYEVPSSLYLTSDGKVIKKQSGPINDAKSFLKTGFEVVNDYTEDETMLQYLKMRFDYNMGQRNFAEMKQLVYLCKEMNRPYHDIVNDYLNGQKMHVQQPDFREFIYDFSNSFHNIAIDYFINDIQFFKETYGSQIINDKVITVIEKGIDLAITTKDKNLLDKAVKIARKANIPNIAHFIYQLQSNFYKQTEAWEAYVKTTNKYLNKQDITNPQLLNDIAYTFYKQVDQKKLLKRALNWVKKSINIEAEHYNHLTYAALLYKLGDVEKAFDVCDKAIQLAKLAGADTSEAIKLRNQISDNFITNHH